MATGTTGNVCMSFKQRITAATALIAPLLSLSHRHHTPTLRYEFMHLVPTLYKPPETSRCCHLFGFRSNSFACFERVRAGIVWTVKFMSAPRCLTVSLSVPPQSTNWRDFERRHRRAKRRKDRSHRPAHTYTYLPVAHEIYINLLYTIISVYIHYHRHIVVCTASPALLTIIMCHIVIHTQRRHNATHGRQIPTFYSD